MKAEDQPEQIERYLFNEMSEAEREQFEDRILADEELFFEIAEAENALVDRYAQNEMSGPELARFEKSLASLPARREKAANAAALLNFMDGGRTETRTITIAERRSVWNKLSDLFSFTSPSFGYGLAGIAVILALATVFLLLENRRLGSEVSSLQGGSEIRPAELDELRRRETQLKTEIENEKDITGDVAADLEAERERVRQLEERVAELNRNNPGPGQPDRTPQMPTVATILLMPYAGTRGGPGPVKRLFFEPTTSKVLVLLVLPDGVNEGGRFSVQLNGKTIADNVKVRVRSGRKSLNVTIPAGDVSNGRNTLTVSNSSGHIGEYIFSAELGRSIAP
jgi:hypothetical protein